MTALRPACPICLDLKLTNLSEHVAWCEQCHIGVQIELPSDPDALYRREQYDLRRTQNPTEDLQKPIWTRYNHDLGVGRCRLEQLGPHLPKTAKTDHCTLTDYGCGNAAFLAAAAHQGFPVRGVELDAAFCSEIHALTGVRTVPASIFLDAPSVYPSCALFLFDVLEHLVSPVTLLKRASECLSHHGVIVLEVPDLGAHSGDITEWKHYKPDEHLTHWTLHAVEALQKRHFREFKMVHHAAPVPGKLQVVLQKYREL